MTQGKETNSQCQYPDCNEEGRYQSSCGNLKLCNGHKKYQPDFQIKETDHIPDAGKMGGKETESVEEMPPLRLEAYYYGFDKTGVLEVDLILASIACAGKAFHHTSEWHEISHPVDSYLNGETPADWIQNAANSAAETITRLSKALEESEREKRWKLAEPDEELRENMDESGFWHSCSGCHETNEGASTGWYSVHPFFKCEQGLGCGECGGLGVIWDDTDYEDMAKWMREEEARQALKGGEG